MSFYNLNRIGNKRLIRKKRGYKHDPIVVLTSVVLVGVLLSGLTSFGF